MFTVCLAFIVFAGVMFALQARSLEDNVKVCYSQPYCILCLSLKPLLLSCRAWLCSHLWVQT